VALDSTFNIAGAKSDGSDVRITSDGGITPIPFWIESWNSASKTGSLWVKVPTIPSGGANSFLYYGNPAASSASNERLLLSFLMILILRAWIPASGGRPEVPGGL
jgi:hypothetical protein